MAMANHCCVPKRAPVPTKPAGLWSPWARKNTWPTLCNGSPWPWRCWRFTSTSDGITKRRSPMGAVMNPPSTSDTPDRRKGRWQLILILMMVIGPMVLATFMYKLQFWVPDSRSYHGELIGNGQTRADIGVQADEQRWQLLVTAPTPRAAHCQQLVYLARQLQLSLGRDASRASHALAGAQPLSGEYEAKLKAEYPQLQRYPLDVS